MDISLQTKVTFDQARFIDDQVSLVFLGSCFADRIGDRFDRAMWNALVNPWGVIYNPVSLRDNLRRAINSDNIDANRLLYLNELWSSFDVHGSSSHPQKEVLLNTIATCDSQVRAAFESNPVLVLTLGTAIVYEHAGRVVANCHKQPAGSFRKRMLSVEEVVNALTDIVDNTTANKVVLTVSPVRHTRDGLHQNNLSKATLLLAANSVCSRYDHVHYFGAYEIVMDELRDYRFFTSDLVHPNETALDFVFNSFVDVHCADSARMRLNEWKKIENAINHKPLHPERNVHQRFIKKTEEQLQQYIEKYDVPKTRTEKLKTQRDVRQ